MIHHPHPYTFHRSSKTYPGDCHVIAEPNIWRTLAKDLSDNTLKNMENETDIFRKFALTSKCPKYLFDVSNEIVRNIELQQNLDVAQFEGIALKK